jgi:hypothetical protein
VATWTGEIDTGDQDDDGNEIYEEQQESQTTPVNFQFSTQNQRTQFLDQAERVFATSLDLDPSLGATYGVTGVTITPAN